MWSFSTSKEKESAQSEVEVGLLGEEKQVESLHLNPRWQEWRPTSFFHQNRYVLVHVVLLLSYTLIYLTLITRPVLPSHRDGSLLYTPAAEAVSYEKKMLHNAVHAADPFKGAPRPEMDEAWHDLLQYNNIRVTKEELNKMNRTSVQLADGSGEYLAALDVFHHLHCIKYIKHYLHQEYYKIPETNVRPEDHVDHCLDAIRKELMCKADISLTTYEWIPDLRIPWAFLSYEHECVNWDSLQVWAKQRTLDIRDPKYLVHPALGTSFPPSPHE